MARMKAPEKMDRRELSVAKVKYNVKSNKRALEKLNYIEFRSHDGYRTPDALVFDANNDRVHVEEFIQNSGIRNDIKAKGKFPIMYELILSVPDEFVEGEAQYQKAVRKVLSAYSKRKNVDFDWVSAVHDPEGKSHVHVMIRAEGRILDHRDDEKQSRFVTFKKDDIYWIRNEFKKEMGLKWVKDKYAENEIRISERAKELKDEWMEFRWFLEKEKNKRRVGRGIKNLARMLEGGNARGRRNGAISAEAERVMTLFGKGGKQGEEKLFER